MSLGIWNQALIGEVGLNVYPKKVWAFQHKKWGHSNSKCVGSTYAFMGGIYNGFNRQWNKTGLLQKICTMNIWKWVVS